MIYAPISPSVSFLSHSHKDKASPPPVKKRPHGSYRIHDRRNPLQEILRDSAVLAVQRFDEGYPVIWQASSDVEAFFVRFISLALTAGTGKGQGYMYNARWIPNGMVLGARADGGCG